MSTNLLVLLFLSRLEFNPLESIENPQLFQPVQPINFPPYLLKQVLLRSALFLLSIHDSLIRRKAPFLRHPVRIEFFCIDDDFP